MKIFWSWQDDSPSVTNRVFIKTALESAVSELAVDFKVEDADRPELDHDTKGVAGAAEIVPLLMDKIANSAVFVGDVTPVGTTPSGKPLPNANVMVELGWSLNRPGWQRQIYVLNTGFGHRIEDLPFDIRSRRVLTYNLPEGASKPERASARTRLANELKSAIKTNLDHHVEEMAAASPIEGVPARHDVPSLWEGSEQGTKHHDSCLKGFWRHIRIAEGPRIYIRIIPAGWGRRPPGPHAIETLDDRSAPYSDSHHVQGDFGATPEGYVRYWYADEEQEKEERCTADLAMYFEDTGEFWVVTGSPVVTQTGTDRRAVDLADVFRLWATVLRRANWVMDHFGARAARRVEAGFTGLEDVRFPGGWNAARPPARRSELRIDRTQAGWTDERQEGFLADALDKVIRLFGLPALSSAQAEAFLRANDPERGREGPIA